MGMFGKLKEMFTEYDDEYEEEMEPAPEVNDFDRIKQTNSSESPSAFDEYEHTSRTAAPAAPSSNRSKVVNINATTQLQVVLVKPERFEDARGIAQHLNAKHRPPGALIAAPEPERKPAVTGDPRRSCRFLLAEEIRKFRGARPLAQLKEVPDPGCEIGFFLLLRISHLRSKRRSSPARPKDHPSDSRWRAG